MSLVFVKSYLSAGLISAVIAVAAGLAGCSQEKTPTSVQSSRVQPRDAGSSDKASPERELLAEGEALFGRLCATCHGSGGSGHGSRRGPSLQRPEFTYGRTPSSIQQSIREGRPGGMPSFGHVFSPRQLEALSAYVLSLKK